MPAAAANNQSLVDILVTQGALDAKKKVKVKDAFKGGFTLIKIEI